MDNNNSAVDRLPNKGNEADTANAGTNNRKSKAQRSRIEETIRLQ